MSKDARAVIKALRPRLDPRTGVPFYRQFNALVRGAIEQGQLKPGDALPPQREISQIVGISEVTIRRALQELADSGLIEARAGSGTIVLDPHTKRRPQPQPRTETSSGTIDVPPSRPADGVLSIGIAFASLSDGYPFFRPMLEGMRRDAPRPVAVRLFDIPAADLPSGSLDHAPDLHGLDGLIMMSPVNLQLVALCQQRQLPCVLLYTDISDGFSRCVVVDYTAGLLQAARHLRERGRRRLALVTAGGERFSTGQITDAYRSAIDLFGFESHDGYVVQAGYDEHDGHRAMRQLLAHPQRPDAVLLASDYQARGALLALHEAQVSVPQEMAVVGIGHLFRNGGWPVPLTTIDLRFDAVGAAARELIDAHRAGKASELPYRTSIRSELRIGQTT